MPKLINAYAADDTLTNAFAKLGESFVSNTPALELARQKAFGLSRDNQSYQVLQDAERMGGYDPNNPEVRAAIVGLDKPVEYSQAQRFISSTRDGAGSQKATNAYVGAGGAYGSTVQGTQEAEANRRAIESERTNRQFAIQQYNIDNTPANVIGPGGVPMVVPKSLAISQRMQPVLGHGDVQGTILQNDLPNLTPEQRATAGGYGSKNPGTLWTYQTPDGRSGTTADGRADVNSGAPLPQGTKVIKLEGPNVEGLTSDNTVNRDLVNSEVAMKQSTSMIDNLIADLSKPNAAQSVGYIGSIANTLNGWRAQSEAASRAIGGLSKDQAVEEPGVKQTIDQVISSLNPALVSKLQTMGIDSAVVRSQIHDLAYVIARSQDPSGRISKDDVLRAGETIGASLMDPVAGVQVLKSLRGRIEQNWKIKDDTVRARYGKPATPAAPTAAPAAAAPQQNNVVDWQTYFGAPQ